jgi:hypothetical protein
VKVSDVLETTDTFVAKTPPTHTLLTPVRPVPVKVTLVPPALVPNAGETDVIVGVVGHWSAEVTTMGCGLAYA